MAMTIDEWVTVLNRKMHKAYDLRISEELDENWDEDPEDFDGLSETQLDEFVEQLADSIIEGYVIEPDNHPLAEILKATKIMLEQKSEIAGFWTYETVTNALSQLDA